MLDPKMSEDSESMDKTPDRRAWFKVSDMLNNIKLILIENDYENWAKLEKSNINY